jgi:hypothetical protein
VEVLELKNGSVRNLPLSAVWKIHNPRRKNEAQRPREDVLQMKDGSTTLEAKSLDDPASQLRQRYPEGLRTHLAQGARAPGRAATADAMNNLIEILVDAFVKEAAP